MEVVEVVDVVDVVDVAVAVAVGIRACLLTNDELKG